MILETYRETACDLGERASQLTRMLSCFGIAIIWVFRPEQIAGVVLPVALFLPGFFIVLVLTLDLAQYVIGGMTWAAYARIKERHGVMGDRDFKAHPLIKWFATTAFVSIFYCNCLFLSSQTLNECVYSAGADLSEVRSEGGYTPWNPIKRTRDHLSLGQLVQDR